MGPRPDSREHSNDTPERVASLLAAAARGDDAAWREIIALYGRRVYALAQTRLRHPELAEEITQSVFATVAVKLGEAYAEQGRFESWLFRIAMNRVRDEVRRQHRQAELRDPSTLGHLAAKAEHTEPAEVASLRRALAKLPDADREVVELRHHGGMSFKQMVELLNEPLGTLLARHHRALRKLKQFMESEEQPENSGQQETHPGRETGENESIQRPARSGQVSNQ
jgi:RNA polymerase sigma-70 factor, ECF subfamily